jgi:hypothetical protein
MKINIGIPVDLRELLETRALILSDSGHGKSWLIRKMAEECSGKVQQIIFDPEGDFITLREKYPFALISKAGGDLPLNIRHAETLAHKILETGLSVIIDLYELKKPDRIEFVRVFTDALIEAPKKIRRSCIVYYDEAQMFCPQDKSAASTWSIIDICTRGRKRGLCAVLATHRASIMNNDAMAQCKNKFMGSTSLPDDQKKVAHELGLYDKEEIRNLRNLGKGEFWTFGAAISKEIKLFKVGQVKTTHLKSGGKLKSPPPTPSAIKKIVSKLESIPEEAEVELKSKADMMLQIKLLRQQLKQIPKIQPAPDNKHEAKLLQQLDSLRNQAKAISDESNQWQRLAKEYHSTLYSVSCYFGKKIPECKIQFNKKLHSPTTSKIPVHQKDSPVSKQLRDSGYKPINDNVGDVSLPEGEKKILTWLCQKGCEVDRSQLTIMTGYKRSSRDAYIARLKNKGYVASSGSGIEATQAGVNALGGNYTPLPTGDALQEYWLKELPEGERKILEVLIAAYPYAVSRDAITDKTNYMRSSRDAYIARAKTKELIVDAGSGMIKAADTLFD